MKKTITKKLTLRPLTITHLTLPELANVAAGAASKPGSGCMTCNCITPSCTKTL